MTNRFNQNILEQQDEEQDDAEGTRRKEEENITHPPFFSTQSPIILLQHPINAFSSKTSSYSLVHSRENDSIKSVEFFESDWRRGVFG